MTKIIKYLLLLVFVSACSTNKTNIQNKLPHKVEVAILMPISLSNAETGKRLSNLVRLGIEDLLRGNVGITIYDSATEEFINKSMEQIIQRKTKIILGPLLASEVSLIKDKAKANNIDIITLSNSSSIIDTNVFVFGHTPLKQTERIINYLLSNRNYKNFILLLPNASHTSNLIKVLSQMIESKGGKVCFAEKYDSSIESMNEAVNNVQEIVDEINESGENKAKPLIYVADEIKNLSHILNLLHKNKIDRRAIIFGDNRLDIDNNVEVIFTGSLNHLNTKVFQRVGEAGVIRHLNYMDKLAYDLGSLIGYAIGEEEFSRENFHLLLNNQFGYRNTSGIFRFSNGIAERKYDIIKKKDGKYSTIDKSEDFGEISSYVQNN